MNERMRELFDDLKAKHNGAVLLFNFGDEYHAFYEDAALLRRTYGGGNKFRFVIPVGEVQSYINQLYSDGYQTQIITEEES